MITLKPRAAAGLAKVWSRSGVRWAETLRLVGHAEGLERVRGVAERRPSRSGCPSPPPPGASVPGGPIVVMRVSGGALAREPTGLPRTNPFTRTAVRTIGSSHAQSTAPPDPASPPPARPTAPPAGWTFLSNHAHVLLCLTEEEAPRLRDVAARVGITERAVQKIVLDLERQGILRRRRDGRRNTYAFDLDHPLRHPIEAHRSVRALLDLVR